MVLYGNRTLVVYVPRMELLSLPAELIAELVMVFLDEADAKNVSLASKAMHLIAERRLVDLAVGQRRYLKCKMLAQRCWECFQPYWENDFCEPVGICCKMDGDSCMDFFVPYDWTENECFSSCLVRDELLMHMATEHPAAFEAIITEQEQINQHGKRIIERVLGKGSEADFIDYPIYARDESDPDRLRLIQVGGHVVPLRPSKGIQPMVPMRV